MPAKRRPLNRASKHRITPQAVEAYKARDYLALHRALGLYPWEMSPLPDDPLGCNPNWVMPEHTINLFELSFPQALALQRELEKASRA